MTLEPHAIQRLIKALASSGARAVVFWEAGGLRIPVRIMPSHGQNLELSFLEQPEALPRPMEMVRIENIDGLDGVFEVPVRQSAMANRLDVAMPTSMVPSQRAHIRLSNAAELRIPVKFTTPTSESEGTIRDLSLGGISMLIIHNRGRMPEVLASGSISVKQQFGDPIVIPVEVRRRQNLELGMAFMTPEPPSDWKKLFTQIQIDSFVRGISRKAA